MRGGGDSDGTAGSEPSVLCRCYTKARRHPKVVGSVQGHALPFGLILWTIQVAVLVGSFVAMMWTRGLWGQVVPGGIGQLVVLVAVPVALTWAVRFARMEGRSPVQMMAGAAGYAKRRVSGVQLAGRAVRDSQRSVVRGQRIFVTGTGGGGARRPAQPLPLGRGKFELVKRLACEAVNAGAQVAALDLVVDATFGWRRLGWRP